jgi:hypothetical protein
MTLLWSTITLELTQRAIAEVKLLRKRLTNGWPNICYLGRLRASKSALTFGPGCIWRPASLVVWNPDYEIRSPEFKSRGFYDEQ